MSSGSTVRTVSGLEHTRPFVLHPTVRRVIFLRNHETKDENQRKAARRTALQAMGWQAQGRGTKAQRREGRRISPAARGAREPVSGAREHEAPAGPTVVTARTRARGAGRSVSRGLREERLPVGPLLDPGQPPALHRRGERPCVAGAGNAGIADPRGAGAQQAVGSPGLGLCRSLPRRDLEDTTPRPERASLRALKRPAARQASCPGDRRLLFGPVVSGLARTVGAKGGLRGGRPGTRHPWPSRAPTCSVSSGTRHTGCSASARMRPPPPAEKSAPKTRSGERQPDSPTPIPARAQRPRGIRSRRPREHPLRMWRPTRSIPTHSDVRRRKKRLS